MSWMIPDSNEPVLLLPAMCFWVASVLSGRRQLEPYEADIEQNTMMEHYLQIKAVHVHLVMLSGFLFFIRGAAAAFWGANWPRHAVLRYASYSIDSCLLAAAAVLLMALQHSGAVAAGFFANGWLAVKLLLLVLYVVLGMLAMRPKLGRASRVVCYITALATFAFMYSVARSHHPLGCL